MDKKTQVMVAVRLGRVGFGAVLMGSLMVFGTTQARAQALKLKTPNPYRPVVVAPVATMPFTLPNGARVDLAADLHTLLKTALGEKSRFLPLEGDPISEPCHTTLKVQAALTTLDVNVVDFGVKFGYKPDGETSPIKGVNVEARVKVGTLAMDFSVLKCVGRNCVRLISETATQATAGVGLSGKIDFGAIEIGPELIYNSPIGAVLRAVMRKGIEKLANSSRVPKLAWESEIKHSYGGGGTFLIGHGTQDAIGPAEAFDVYRKEESEEGCSFYRPLGWGHTVRVDAMSSLLTLDQLYGGSEVEAGDWVVVRELNKR